MRLRRCPKGSQDSQYARLELFSLAWHTRNGDVQHNWMYACNVHLRRDGNSTHLIVGLEDCCHEHTKRHSTVSLDSRCAIVSRSHEQQLVQLAKELLGKSIGVNLVRWFKPVTDFHSDIQHHTRSTSKVTFCTEMLFWHINRRRVSASSASCQKDQKSEERLHKLHPHTHTHTRPTRLDSKFVPVHAA